MAKTNHKEQIEAMGWDNASFTAKGGYKGAMKMYNGCPIFFGAKYAFALDFNFEYGQPLPDSHDWMSFDEFLGGLKNKIMVLHSFDEEVQGAILIADYDTIEGTVENGEGLETLKDFLGITDTDIADIEARVEKLAGYLFETT